MKASESLFRKILMIVIQSFNTRADLIVKTNIKSQGIPKQRISVKKFKTFFELNSSADIIY